jgi:ankyrin repeat protein
MPDQPRSLDRITIPVPCDADWDSMSGNDQVRFCEHCNLQVRDISSLTQQNVMRLVARSQGRLCVRYTQLGGGGVLARAPEKLHRISRRVSRMAAGAFTASLTLASAAAQTSFRPSADVSRQASAIANVIAGREQGTSLSGVVTDPNGAVVSGATVTLTNPASNVAFNFITANDGAYKFSLLEAGVYSLSVEAPTFAKAEAVELNLGPNVNRIFNLAVNLPVFTEQVEIRSTVSVVSIQGGVSMRVPEDPLVNAAFKDDLNAVKQLVRTSPDVNVSDKATDQTALAYATENGNLEMVQTLLVAGADINANSRDGQTALMYLSKKADLDFVRQLLAAGADVNARDQGGETPLLKAATSSSLAVFQELISHGANVFAENNEGTTVLMRAAENADPQIATLLLKSGVSVNAQDANKETALLIAANWGSAATVKVLIDARADMNMKDSEGKTALILAASNEDARLAKLLIDESADVDAKEHDGNTALMIAVDSDRVQTIGALIEADAKIDATDNDGWTALMRANQPETVLLLLNAGADLTIKNKEGQTALSLARKGELGEIVKLLKSRGAPE